MIIFPLFWRGLVTNRWRNICFMKLHCERAAHMLEIGCTAPGWPKRYLVDWGQKHESLWGRGDTNFGCLRDMESIEQVRAKSSLPIKGYKRNIWYSCKLKFLFFTHDPATHQHRQSCHQNPGQLVGWQLAQQQAVGLIAIQLIVTNLQANQNSIFGWGVRLWRKALMFGHFSFQLLAVLAVLAFRQLPGLPRHRCHRRHRCRCHGCHRGHPRGRWQAIAGIALRLCGLVWHGTNRDGHVHGVWHGLGATAGAFFFAWKKRMISTIFMWRICRNRSAALGLEMIWVNCMTIMWNKQLVKVGIIPLPPIPTGPVHHCSYRCPAISWGSWIFFAAVAWTRPVEHWASFSTGGSNMQLFHGVGSLESLQETSTIERGAFLLFQLHHASNSGNVVTWAWVKGYGIRQILKLAALQILRQ